MTQKTITKTYCDECGKDITGTTYVTTEGYPHFKIWSGGESHVVSDGDFCDASCYRNYLMRFIREDTEK